MMKLQVIRRAAVGVLLALILMRAPLCPAQAEECGEYDFASLGLDGVLAAYMEEKNLDIDNFGMCWYDITSGESWYFAEEVFRVGGSMYKLPLNMVLTDMMEDGTLENSTSVERLRFASITYSDNEAAQYLRGLISENNIEYRTTLAAYSGYAAEELPDGYFHNNEFSPRFMLNTLLYLYENSTRYDFVIDCMKQAHPDAYFRKEQGDYEIAHKYGSFEGALNDCGIIYTPRPFLLVVMLQDVSYSERVLAELCHMMVDYSFYLEEQAEQEAAARKAEEERRAQETCETQVQLEAEPLDGAENQAGTQDRTELLDTVNRGEAVRTSPARREKKDLPLWAGAGLLVFCAVVLTALLLTLRFRRLRWLRVPLLLALIAAVGLLISARLHAQTPAAQQKMPSPTEPPAAVSAQPQTPDTPEPIVSAAVSSEPDTPDEIARKTEWLLSFAGDCTIGTLHEWQNSRASNNMLYVMGDDFSYPLRNAAEYFGADDFTMVNLEGAFTNETAAKGKDYRFRSGPEYVQVLTQGGVDAVTLANNHAGDYLEQGLKDTKKALDDAGVAWGDGENALIAELDGGLVLGVLTFNTVEIDLAVGDVAGYLERIAPLYEATRRAGCDVVIAFLHWGWEYTSGPEDWMRELAHSLADMGCGLILGSHAHVLQEAEYYKGVPIFYSLGNFCFGGHSNPDDQDSVIIQQRIVRDEDGNFTLGKTEAIPFCISSSPERNDFCPVPYPEDGEGYRRVLEKLKLEP